MLKKTKSSKGASGWFASNRTVGLLSFLLLVSLVLALLSFFHVERWSGYNDKFLLKTAEQQILAQQIVQFTPEAVQGSEAAFEQLRQIRDRFHTRVEELKQGSVPEALPPSPLEVQPLLHRVERAWSAQREHADRVLANQASILAVLDLLNTTKALVTELSAVSGEAAQLMVVNDQASGQTQAIYQVYLASTQMMLAQRMRNKLNNLLVGGEFNPVASDQFSADAARFGLVLRGMLNGDAKQKIDRAEDEKVRKKLQQTTKLYGQISANTTNLAELMPNVLPALKAAGNVRSANDQLNSALTELIAAYRGSPGRFSVAGVAVGPWTVLLFGGLAVLFLVLLGVQLLADAHRREEESKAQNEVNQQAILRLLDEMGDLADGDLTVEATVTEDITGAIADSVNFAIDALRNLVTTINTTADKVTGSVQDTRATTLRLAEASEGQAQQITQATGVIHGMTEAIDEVAKNAEESAEVASRSVEIAGKGAQTVRGTIQGMDTIREQIQETAKRIKRLGESSQEIGEIVELIDDIADQTNILALNAAMQAAMAGEAGRGFAVVADEVQRLAERSSSATKQIEALVKTIQADTNEAVSSMEASTTGVVNGAKLSEDAGEALREIENVSNYIADLTRKISDSAQQQSQEAGRINDTVNTIQETTNETSDGTRKTAASVETLADLVVELQRSVAGFRLPG